MPSRTNLLLAVVLVAVVAVAGCSGSGGSGGNATGASSAAAGAESAGQAGNQQAIQARRAIIKTGHVQLTVDNFTAAQRSLTEAVGQRGGYVSGSEQTTRTVDGENVTTGRLVLRVPSRNFSVVLSRVQAAGVVVDSRTNTTDVTGRVVDLRARLNNSRAQRDRLRDLYANASSTEATLKVQQRLSAVESRIERLQGRLKSLRGRVAYSTISVRLSQSAPEHRVDQWYDVGVLHAFLASVGGVAAALRAIVVGIAYLAPYLVVFGVPIGAAGYVVYRRQNVA